MRRRDEVDVVAATHEVELDPPQHARVDEIGEDHLNPTAVCHGLPLYAARTHAHTHARATGPMRG